MSVDVRDQDSPMPEVLRQRGGLIGSDDIPLYEACWGATAVFFAGGAPVAFLAGIVDDGYGFVDALMNFRMRCWKLKSEVVVGGENGWAQRDPNLWERRGRSRIQINSPQPRC